MLKVALFLLIAYTLSGCGQGFVAIGKIDPEFQPHVDKFVELYATGDIYLDMYFNEQDGNVIGMCRMKGIEKDIEMTLIGGTDIMS